MVMKEKPLCKKKTGFSRIKDNLLSSGEYFINGDNPMKLSRLKQQSEDSESLKIYYNKKPRGEN